MAVPKLLITGASGFLGGALYAQAQEDWRVTALCNTTCFPGMVALDLSQHDAVHAFVRRLRPRVILHVAANANLDACEKNPQQAEQMNLTATATLLEAADAVQARLVFVSSDMVFDGRRGMYRVSDAVSPLSVYGRTKAAAEALILASPGAHVIARAALIYGRPRLGGGSFSVWLESRLREQQAVTLYTDQFRTPVWVENLAAQLLELAHTDFSGIIHCAGAERADRFRFGQILCRLAGYSQQLLVPVSMHDHETAAPRPADVSLDTVHTRQILKTPLLDIEEGLTRMVSQDLKVF